MSILRRIVPSVPPRRAATAIAGWSARAWGVAAGTAVGAALLLGIPTLMIPNHWFHRDVPTEPWNYPVWIVASLLAGLTAGTYVRNDDRHDDAPRPGQPDRGNWGMAGAFLSWFAIGCPVCNKVALLALGYTGAMTYFAPVQPYLAALSLVVGSWALWWRLAGQVSCAVDFSRRENKEPVAF